MSRSKLLNIPVFPADGTHRVIRGCSLRQGEMKESLGEWRREFDRETGVLAGFRVIAPEERRGEHDMPSTPSTASIAGWELELNVERSATRGLNQERRLSRMCRRLADEDVVERVQAKVRVYAVIGSAKGDILRVWPI